MIFTSFRDWIHNNIKNITFPDALFYEIEDVFHYFLENKTTEIDSSFFSKIHSKDKQKLMGITYTPKEIRKELIVNTISNIEKSVLEKKTFCDPCCGSGTFSIDIAKFLHKKDISYENIFNNLIFQKDKDKISILLSLANLFIFLIQQDVSIEKIYPNVEHIDFFASKENYDFYITNPPYIKIQNLDKETKTDLKTKYADVFSGSLGISPLFIYKMLKDANDDGVVAVITQNNIFTSNAAEKIRKKFANHVFLVKAFGHEKKFKNIGAYTCLMFLSKKENKNFTYIKDDDSSTMSNMELDHKKWRLGNNTDINLIKKIENNGVKITELCDIFVGIATLKDKAYTVFNHSGIWYSTSPDNNLYPIESDLVRPLIKVSDISAEEDIHKNSRGVIFPYELINGKFSLIEESKFKHLYKDTYHALTLWEEELNNRSSVKKTNHPWYQWGRHQGMTPINNKLLTKTFNKGPNFLLDSTYSLISNGYGISIKNKDIDILFIQKILNSHFFENYIRKTSYEIDGDYQCYQKNFIEKFRIPNELLLKQNEILEKNINIDDIIADYY